MHDVPLLIVALAIWIYWLRVGAMVIRARRREHHDVGVIPERAGERVMWLVVVPTIVAWIALPTLALTHERGLLAVPAFAREGILYPALRWIAALMSCDAPDWTLAGGTLAVLSGITESWLPKRFEVLAGLLGGMSRPELAKKADITIRAVNKNIRAADLDEWKRILDDIARSLNEQIKAR